MTIQDAIKSGKPFRRPIWPKGVCIRVVENKFVYNENEMVYRWIESPDILATDWEVRE